MKYILLVLFLAGFITFSFVEAAQKPNVIIILIDDQGYYDLSSYGAEEIKTPRIDALAEEGIRFTDYYAAAPICSPSRVGILTGNYPRRIGMEAWVQRADSKRGIHPDEITLGELFKDNGYETACIGKWHLGDKEEFLPLSQGFDYHYGLYSNLDPVEIVYFEEGKVPVMRNGEVVKDEAIPEDLTRSYTDEAIAYIERYKDGPFFLYFPHTMLHVPLGVSEEFRGTSSFGEYGDAIHEMDFHVGRLMDALKANDIADNTVVIYASDNGRGPGRIKGQDLTGTKLTTLECGIRVPGIVWGPGLGILRGVENHEIVNAMDWYPTLASLAGIKISEEHPIIDGRDLLPMLKGECEGIPSPSDKLSINAEIPLRRHWDPGLEWSEYFNREEYLNAFFYHGAEGAFAAVRSGDFKMTMAPRITVYNLKEDPSESTPVRERELLRRMRGMAVLFQEEMSLTSRRPGYVE